MMEKKDKNKKNKDNKIKKRNIFFLVFIIIMSLVALYLIKQTDILLPRVNEATASYISFNNFNTTDMLKITNIKKYSDEIGKSFINNNDTEIEIEGKENDEFLIELYSIGNKLNKKYINYILLENNKQIKAGRLSDCEEQNNGGLILYQGKIKKNTKYKIKLWIDNDYKNKVNNISYEVKIQSR